MTRRTELILRVPELEPAQAERLARALEPIARRLAGSLSAIDREHYPDGHAVHIGRRSIVASGRRVGPRN